MELLLVQIVSFLDVQNVVLGRITLSPDRLTIAPVCPALQVNMVRQQDLVNVHAAMLEDTILILGLRRCLLVRLVQAAATMQERGLLHVSAVPSATMESLLVLRVSLQVVQNVVLGRITLFPDRLTTAPVFLALQANMELLQD